MRFWRTPLDQEKFTTPHGVIHIIIERCKGCEFCVEYCPRGVLQLSKKFNKKGYHYPEAIKEGACVDCDLCESICPEFAIISERVEGMPKTVGMPNAAGESQTASEGAATAGSQATSEDAAADKPKADGGDQNQQKEAQGE